MQRSDICLAIAAILSVGLLWANRRVRISEKLSAPPLWYYAVFLALGVALGEVTSRVESEARMKTMMNLFWPVVVAALGLGLLWGNYRVRVSEGLYVPPWWYYFAFVAIVGAGMTVAHWGVH